MAIAMIGRPSWPYRPARGHDPQGRVLSDQAQLARRRAQIADTWTYIAAACFLVWIVVILLGL